MHPSEPSSTEGVAHDSVPGAGAHEAAAADTHEDAAAEEARAALETVLAGIHEISQALDDADLCPSADRGDWQVQHERVVVIQKRLDNVVLRPLAKAASYFSEAEARDSLHAAASGVLSEYAVLAHASKAPGLDPRGLLREAADLCPAGEAREEMKAGLDDVDGYALLQLGRWHLRHAGISAAEAPFKAVLAGRSVGSLLVTAAKAGLAAPRPLKRAPPLFTLNGFGTHVYGSRDPRPDGSVVKTLCICGLFIPLFPLAAYRAIPNGGDSYLFLHKEKLSGFARGVQLAAVASIALFVAIGFVSSALGSSDYRRPRELAAAEAKVKSSPTDARLALENWLASFQFDASGAEIDRATLAWAKVLLSTVEEPVTVDTAPKVAALISREHKRIPEAARLRKGASHLTEKLLSWSEQLGTSDSERVRAGLSLLDVAWEIAPGPDARQVEEARLAHQVALAKGMSGTEPLEALPLFLDAGTRDGLEAAQDIFARFGQGPTLYVKYEPEVQRFVAGAAAHDDLREVASALSQKVAASKAVLESPARAAVMTNGSAKRLGKWLKKHPGDMEARAVLASGLQQKGKVGRAIAVVEGTEGAGMLLPEDRVFLSLLYLEGDRTEDAVRVLEGYVTGRLPAFTQARAAYDARLKAIQDPIFRGLQIGIAPPELEGLLYGKSDAEQQRVFDEWLGKKLDADAELTRYLHAYEDGLYVVNAALQLGMVKVRHAAAVSGEARERLLHDAEATFLAVQPEAGATPMYRLGLAEVHHRLGRFDDGEREMKALLEGATPELRRAVVDVYRGLGLTERANEELAAL